VLHHPKLAPYTSQALCEFLEVVRAISFTNLPWELTHSIVRLVATCSQEYVEDIASVRSYHSNSRI